MTTSLRSCSLLALLAAGLTVTAAAADTKHVVWRDPGAVEKLDLFWGMGSAKRAPQPPFAFVAEDSSGTKPKINVKDQAGVQWSVKLAPQNPAQNEVHAE